MLRDIAHQPEISLCATVASVKQAVRPFAKKLYGKRAMEMSQAELYAFFPTCERSNLHIVLAFSPIGDAFRDRLRKFPSLINCCVIG